MSGLNVEAIKDKVNTFISQYPAFDGILTQAADATKLEKAYVALIVAAIPILIVFMLGAGHIIIDLVGFVYPVYASIKAIETTKTDDDTLWLTYWIIFGLFKVLESAADALISFIPFYFVGKVSFLVWCYNPSSRGAAVVYKSVIKPYLVPALGIIPEEKTTKSE